jgi:hypothetical protein
MKISADRLPRSFRREIEPLFPRETRDFDRGTIQGWNAFSRNIFKVRKYGTAQ